MPETERESRGRWRDATVPQGCDLRLRDLPVYPVDDSRLLVWQDRLVTAMTCLVADGPEDVMLADLLIAVKAAVQLGRPSMLPTEVDAPVRAAFELFQPVRDRIAVQAGADAEFQYNSLSCSFRLPGPMLMAVALNLVAALSERDPDHRPSDAVRRLAVLHRTGDFEWRLWQRMIFAEGRRGAEVVARAGPPAGALPKGKERRLVRFDRGDEFARRFGFTEHLVALGEWALARDSPVMA